MAMTARCNALFFLFSLFLASSFLAEASLTRSKVHKDEVQTLRGSLKKSTEGGDDSTDDNKDDDDDSDDEADDKKDDEGDDKKGDKKDQKDDDNDDDAEDKKDDKEKVQAVQVESKEHKEVEMLKHQIEHNKHEQEELSSKIKHLTDEVRSDREVDASATLVGNETQSPAMANMLGKMWKEMRMFETPFYAEHVEEEIHHLKLDQRKLEAKLAAAEANHELEEQKANKEKQVVVHTESSKSNSGHDDCPCIGIDQLEGETIATLKDGSKVPYPADLGGRCEAWDLKKHPSCPGAAWCKQEWCYVDPCNCKTVAVLPKPSIYLPGGQYKGKPVHFSYATCGGKDSYSSAKEKKKTQQDIAKTCAVKVDSSKWGADNCRCIGISPQPGTTKVKIENKMVAFPADTGAVCNAWEKDNHPDCDRDDAPDWCSQAWCYVDPCSCKLATPPKVSSYLPSSTYQDKPIYYSYATCGEKDNWTGGNRQACVNQKTGGACMRYDKCAWTGKECLGKELVEVCGLEDKSAAWSPRAIMALVLPLLVLRCSL